jgi:cob(I)alamin adenosyltransferase
MKIYTKTGDEGVTGLFAGPRIPKDDPRIEAYGTVDELNAALGQVRGRDCDPRIDEILDGVQNDLFSMGAELSTPDPRKHGLVLLDDQRVEALEEAIDRMEEQLPPLTQFVLPGGVATAATLHLARAVARRAERRVVALSQAGPEVSARLVRYLNRLGDLLFVMARWANHQAGVSDRPWRKPAPPSP